MNLFALKAVLGLDKKDYDKGLQDAEEKASSSGSGIMNALGNAVKVGTALMAAGVAAASAAIVKTVSDSVTAYADYEQLVGGVQKLYGNMGMSVDEYAKSVGKSVDEVQGEWQRLEDAQNLVMDNAKNAYKTAGMSMNQYMETATSFSAALINSLGGDTVKAAEQTDVAMRAISDNFNTFGGDIGMIQGAFQGFAKQNYTMLDNLKLGYGGTKEEMERLIADANEYAATIGEASDLSIESFADVVTAIDLVQQKQNIAGTTAREASTTIAGSLLTLKSAWQNLITGMGDSEADIGQLITDVVNSAETALGNLLPVIEQSLSGIGQLIENLAPVIAERLPNLVSTVLPQIISTAMSLVGSFGSAIIDNVDVIVETGVESVVFLIDGIISALPKLVDGAIKLVSALVEAIAEHAPSLLESGKELLELVWNGIKDNLPKMLESGADMISNLVNGFLEALPSMIEAVGGLIDEVLSYFLTNMPQFLETGVNLLLNIVNGIINNLPKIIESVLKVITNIIETITKNLPKILEQGITILGKLAAGLIKAIPDLVKQIPTIIAAIVKAFMGFNWLSIGVDILKGVAKGIVNAIGSVVKSARDAAKSIWDSVTGFFSIKSPSRKMAWVGEMIDKGLAQGIDKNMPTIDRAMDNLENHATSAFEVNAPAANGTTTNTSTNYTINVYGAHGQDVKELADIVIERMGFQREREEAVYA